MFKDFFSLIFSHLPSLEMAVLKVVFATAPVWLPVFLIIIGWNLWLRYVRALFITSRKRVLIELKLPKELTKSPAAMELFLTALHQTGREGTWYAKFWEGKSRPWFSLEMASIEGAVRFFIWTEKDFKNLIESQLYSQYPTVELYEAPDYTENMFFDGGKSVDLWGCIFELTKPDPYPIKTYVDYGLEKDIKEEYKIDPITPMIEFMGSIGKGEMVWTQILIRAHKKEQKKSGTWFKKTDSWQDEAKEEIEKIRKEATPKSDDKTAAFPNPTKGQIEMIAALERSIAKLGYDCGIRTIYIAKKDNFNKNNITPLTSVFKQFNSNNLNGFKASKTTSIDYPWQDYKDKRLNKKKKKLINAYKLRSYFFPPYQKKWFVLNTEELATIFHLPGSVSSTPTFSRIVSKKAEPPANLPI